MSSMSTRSALFVGIFLVLAFLSESAPPQRSSPTREASGELPLDDRYIIREEEKNLGMMPPLGDPTFEEDDFGMAVMNPGPQPSDYEDRNPLDEDYVSGFKPGKKPQSFPDVYNGDRTFEDPRDSDIDDDIIKNVDNEKGMGQPKDEDFDRRLDGGEESLEDKDFKIPIPEDEDESFEKDSDDKDHRDEAPLDDDDDDDDDELEGDDNSEPSKHDEDDESDDVPKDVEEEEAEDAEGSDIFHGGLFFDTPFFNIRQVTKYFHQLEKALEHVFHETVNEAALLNGTYANTTKEEVEIHGRKYIVQKSLIQGNDNKSSIYIEALSLAPKMNQTKGVMDIGL